MFKAVLTLLVGLMLSTSISTGDSWAVDQINAPNCTAVEKQILKAEAARLERCGSTAPKDCFDYVISENASYFIKYQADEPSYDFYSYMDDEGYMAVSTDPQKHKYVTYIGYFAPAGSATLDTCRHIKQYDKALDVDLPSLTLFEQSIEGSLHLNGFALWRNNSDISLDRAILDAKRQLASILKDEEVERPKVGSNSVLPTVTVTSKLDMSVDTNLIVTDINQLFFSKKSDLLHRIARRIRSRRLTARVA